MGGEKIYIRPLPWCTYFGHVFRLFSRNHTNGSYLGNDTGCHSNQRLLHGSLSWAHGVLSFLVFRFCLAPYRIAFDDFHLVGVETEWMGHSGMFFKPKRRLQAPSTVAVANYHRLGSLYRNLFPRSF